MSKKHDFTKNVQRMVRKQSLPNSLEEFLNDSSEEKKQNTLDEPQMISKKVIYKREEFKFPYYIAESLRVASYKLNRTKRDIVQEALEDFFIKNNF